VLESRGSPEESPEWSASSGDSDFDDYEPKKVKKNDVQKRPIISRRNTDEGEGELKKKKKKASPPPIPDSPFSSPKTDP